MTCIAEKLSFIMRHSFSVRHETLQNTFQKQGHEFVSYIVTLHLTVNSLDIIFSRSGVGKYL